MRLLRNLTAFSVAFLVTTLVVIAGAHNTPAWVEVVWRLPELLAASLP